RSPPWAEAEARRRETRIEQRLEDLQDRLLDQAIDHRRDAQLALAAAGFGDFHPAHRLRLVAPIEQCGEQRILVPGDPGPQVVDGHPVHSWRPPVRLHPLVGLVQIRRAGDPLHQPPRQGSFPLPRRLSLLLLARPRPGSAEARTAVAHRCLQGLVKEVQLLADALPPRRFHRVALVCSLAQRFSPSRRPREAGPTMASADSSAAIGCRRRHPAPAARRADEVSHGNALHFLGSAAGSTRACDGRSIGRPRPWPGCPTALALYPMSVRRPPDLPPASSPPRIAATQLPSAIGSAPCGPKRTCTSKFTAMRGTPWVPAFAGKTKKNATISILSQAPSPG